MLKTPDPRITEEFLTNVLQDVEGKKGEKIIIKNFTAQKASLSGDNYTSYVYRVVVEYHVDCTLKKESLIVKIPHNSPNFQLFFSKIFQKELYVYADLLPKIYDLLQIDKYFSPRLLHANRSYELALQDLKACDYMMLDRCKMLDFNHCVLSLTTLAKFHAASVVLVEKHPEILDHLAWEFLYSEQMKPRNTENLLDIAKNFISRVESWNVLENFRARSKRIWDTIVDEMIELCKPRKNALNVVNHGDTWTNNLLFKYDDSGRPVHVKLIDFQVCRYTSPAMDIQYFLFTSARDDVMESRLSELQDAYLDALNKQLEELGSTQRLSRQELERELHVSYPYVFTIVYNVLPFVFTEPRTVIDFSDYGSPSFKLSIDDIYKLLYSSKNYKPMAIRGLRLLERNGFF